MDALFASIDLAFLIASVAKIVFLTFLVILPMVAYSVYAERKVFFVDAAHFVRGAFLGMLW